MKDSRPAAGRTVCQAALPARKTTVSARKDAATPGKATVHGRKDAAHGLKDDSHGLKDNFHGLKDNFHGLKDNFHGLKDDSHGLEDNFHGLKDAAHGRKLAVTFRVGTAPYDRKYLKNLENGSKPLFLAENHNWREVRGQIETANPVSCFQKTFRAGHAGFIGTGLKPGANDNANERKKPA